MILRLFKYKICHY